jgi:hypothetical protein
MYSPLDGADSIEIGSSHYRCGYTAKDADTDSHAGDTRSLLKDHPDKLVSPGSQGDADAQFLLALADGIGTQRSTPVQMSGLGVGSGVVAVAALRFLSRRKQTPTPNYLPCL